MTDVQFEGENTYASQAQSRPTQASFLKKLAMKMGAKDDSQVQKIQLGIVAVMVILTIIVLSL